MITKTPIKMNDIEFGQLLDGAIVDSNDRVLFRRGLKMSAVLQEMWRKQGDVPFFIMRDEAERQLEESPNEFDTTEIETDDEPFVITTNEFDTTIVAATREWYTTVVSELQELVVQLAGENYLTLRSVEDAVDVCWDLLQQDAAIVVFEGLTLPASASAELSLARRSSALAAISVAVAREFGLGREECAKVGLAALLHDLALFPAILTRFQDAFDSPEEKQSVITRHPFFTTDMLSARVGLHEVVRIVINQVHEQLDGTGYPRGMPGHLINVMARIINLTDAFLSMIALCSHNASFVAGDAIAYLIHHSTSGAFDCEVTRAFLDTLSLYGIGSQVELDDARTAIVLRSVGSKPMQPIVAVESQQEPGRWETIDLEAAGLSIVGPALEARNKHRKRMSRRRMEEVLWRDGHLVNMGVRASRATVST